MSISTLQFFDATRLLLNLSKCRVVTALQARKTLVKQGIIGHEREVDIIDSPYLSDIPNGLRNAISSGAYESVLFADICKEGPGSNILSSTIMGLKKDGVLPANWDFVAAPRTYNPLGSVVTFLNEEDIVSSFKKLTASSADAMPERLTA